MNENLQKLKSIGIQKIHERTHIPRVHVESLLNENFENMNNIQLSGFIYVLEREYSLDLSDLKKSSADYFQNSKSMLKKEKSVVLFGVSKRKRNYAFIYIVLALSLFVLFAYFNMESSETQPLKVDNTTIENAKSVIAIVSDDKNKSEENSTITAQTQESLSAAQQNAIIQNMVQPIEEPKSLDSLKEAQETPKEEPLAHEPLKEQDSKESTPSEAAAAGIPAKLKEEPQSTLPAEQKEAVQAQSFKIIALNKVWLGYIDLSNNKKYQKTFSGEFELDPAKNWLLSFGHGTIDIQINGVVTKYRKLSNIRFSYIDSKLKEIDSEEFKALNKGEKW